MKTAAACLGGLLIMATIVAHDGTIYATTIYPFTLLRVPAIP